MQLFLYMIDSGNNSAEDFQASGAYAFRPNGSDPEMINHSHPDLTIDEVCAISISIKVLLVYKAGSNNFVHCSGKALLISIILFNLVNEETE